MTCPGFYFPKQDFFASKSSSLAPFYLLVVFFLNPSTFSQLVRIRALSAGFHATLSFLLQKIPSSMQILTFTQKLLRQRRFLSSFILLFALFIGLGALQKVQAQAAYSTDYVTISATPITPAPISNITYAGRTAGTPPFFQGADLGNGAQFDQAAGASTLTLTASSANLLVFPNTAVPSSRTFYRVFLQGATIKPAYTQIDLTQTSPTNNSIPVNYGIGSLTIDLLHQPSVLGGGIYVVEVEFASTVNGTNNAMPPAVTSTSILTDDNGGGNGFQATFSVLAPAVTPPNGTTTWTATVSTEWTLASNWSNGVPTQFSDAIIPEKNSTSTNTSTPALLDPNPNLYNVRTISLNGTSNATRALLRIGQTLGGATSGATLNVFGDLNTFSGGILANQAAANGVQNAALNSTVAFRGDNQQVVRGLLVASDITISGNGNKLVVFSINAPNTFTFLPGTTAHVRTVSESINTSTGVSTFTFNTTKTSTVDLKSTGTLFGETNNAFIEGVALANRNLLAGVTQTFGNIGVDITPNRDITGPTVEITRTIGDPLSGPVGSNSRPVKRQYGVSGDVNNSPTVSTLTFHYLNSPDELNGNLEQNLTIFKTSNNGIPYQLIGGTADLIAHSVTKTGVTAINTVTLGDRNNPLPVTVASFDAKRIGSDALVSWSTAQEINNKGFNVQVSIDAKTYRTIGFVASETPNSSSLRSYSFTDTEKGKIGVRYYRLQQVDTDDKVAFFAPRAVTFEGRATESGVTAYPNPYTNDLRVSLSSPVSGNATARLTDMTGRVISQQVLPLIIGSNDLPLENMNGLKNGLYLLNMTLPSGEVKTMKVMKQ